MCVVCGSFLPWSCSLNYCVAMNGDSLNTNSSSSVYVLRESTFSYHKCLKMHISFVFNCHSFGLRWCFSRLNTPKLKGAPADVRWNNFWLFLLSVFMDFMCFSEKIIPSPTALSVGHCDSFCVQHYQLVIVSRSVCSIISWSLWFVLCAALAVDHCNLCVECFRCRIFCLPGCYPKFKD